jgi:hypothetical protein
MKAWDPGFESPRARHYLGGLGSYFLFCSVPIWIRGFVGRGIELALSGKWIRPLRTVGNHAKRNVVQMASCYYPSSVSVVLAEHQWPCFPLPCRRELWSSNGRQVGTTE